MAPTLEQIAQEELIICHNILKTNGAIGCLPPKLLENFIQRSLLTHRRLIERWGGCIWFGKPQDGLSADDETYRIQEATRLWQEVLRIDGLARLQLINSAGESLFANSAYVLQNKLLDTKNYKNCALYVMVGGIRGQIPARNGQRISSLVQRLIVHIRKDARKSVVASERLATVIPTWEKLLKDLGEQVWTGKAVPAAIALSVRPSHFLSLGNLNEGASCYKNGLQHDSSKVYLGADVPDSFVVLTYRGAKKVERMQDAQYAPQGRAWGIAIPGRGAVFTNFYKITKALVEKNVLDACVEGLGVREPKPFAAQALSVRNHNAAFYTNADVSYYGPVEEQKYISTYLTEVLAYSSTNGKFTNNGLGPVLMNPHAPYHNVQELDGFGRLIMVDRPNPAWQRWHEENAGKKLPPPQPPKEWPYQDFDIFAGTQEAHLQLRSIAP